MKTLAEQVEAFMAWRSHADGRELSASGMAELVAKNQGELEPSKRCTRQNIETLISKKLRTTRYMVALAMAMGTTAETLQKGLYETPKAVQPLVADDYENLDGGPLLRAERGVPVVGEVKGGPDGFLEELQYPDSHGDGFVAYPTSDPEAFALRVRGDSMHPRYRAGEFIVVEPKVDPQPGDDVVVALRDGRKLLKELNWDRDGEIQLLSVNNHFAPLTIAKSEVLSIRLVAGRVRRSAFSR